MSRPRYRAAAHFEDATTVFPVLSRHEVWQLINLTGDTHPIHVHLDPLPDLRPRIEDIAITAAVTLEPDAGDKLAHSIGGNERGLKDTIRPGATSMGDVAAPAAARGPDRRAQPRPGQSGALLFAPKAGSFPLDAGEMQDLSCVKRRSTMPNAFRTGSPSRRRR